MASKKDEKDMGKHIVGSCLGMCPNAELRLRQREQLLHPLERSIDPRGGNHSRPEPRAMVKEFSRSAAGHQIKPSDVRPLPVLIKTVKYLLVNVCCREDVPWALVYQFVNDRLRAVRQDFCVQGVRVAGLGILLAAVRFYVYAQYRTCEHDLSDFDPYLNMKHLGETLSLVITLFQESDKERMEKNLSSANAQDEASYFKHCDVCDESSDESSCSDDSESDDVNESKITQDAVASEKDSASRTGKQCEGTDQNTPDDTIAQEQSERQESHHGSSNISQTASNSCDDTASSPSSKQEERKVQLKFEMLKCSPREEAEALNLLVSFGQEEALMHVFQLPPGIRQSRVVWIATQMNLAWLSNNYHRVLRLAPLLPPLCLTAFHYHLTTVQRRALSILNSAHSSRGGLVYSGDDLAVSLKFPSTTTLLEACTYYGLTTTPLGVIFTKGSFNYHKPLIKTSRNAWINERVARVSVPNLLLPSGQSLTEWLAR